MQPLRGITCALAAALLGQVVQAADWPVLRGDYLGQVAPGPEPEVFAPGLISHGFHELGITFSPAGDEVFYVMSDGSYQRYFLVRVARDGDRWGRPEIAPFARELSVYSVCFHPRGDRIFFTGKPAGAHRRTGPQHDIHVAVKTGTGWRAGKALALNSEQAESSVSVAADGTLFYSRHEPGEPSDLWTSRLDGTEYTLPVRLPAPVNTDSGESRPYVAPDQSYLLFQSNRDGTLGSFDIYACQPDGEGGWTTPVNLGEAVNSEASDFAPAVSPDGRYLFFSSYRRLPVSSFVGRAYAELLQLFRQPANGYSTLYWMDARTVSHLASSP